MKKWLKSAGGILLTSVVFLNDVSSIQIYTSSPHALYQSMEFHVEFYPRGRYLIRYEESETEEQELELESKRYVWAIAHEADLVDGTKLGDLTMLREELYGYEYCVTNKTEKSGFNILGVLVVQPNSIEKLEMLVDILRKYAPFVSIDDGSGTMHPGNTRIGKVHSVHT
jgi:hypothetical protein